MKAILWVLSDTPTGMMTLSINVDNNTRILGGYFTLGDFYSVRVLCEAMDVRSIAPEDSATRKWSEAEIVACEAAFEGSGVEFI